MRRELLRAAKKQKLTTSEYIRDAVRRKLWLDAFDETRRALIPKPHARVAAVAERLSGRVTATAQGNYGPSGQAVRISLRVQYLKLPFYADGAVVKWRDFN